MTNERIKEVKANITSQVTEMVANNIDIREAFIRNEKAFEAYVLQSVIAVICTRAVEPEIVKDMDGANLGQIVDSLLPGLFTEKELSDYFRTIILKVANEDIPLCVGAIALVLFGVEGNCYKDMPVLSKIINDQFEALCEDEESDDENNTIEEKEMPEFNEKEFHEFMDALLDKKSDIGKAIKKLSNEFCDICLSIEEALLKRQVIDLKWLNEHISGAEFLAAFLSRFYTDEDINKYIIDMTDKILEEDEFADEGDIAQCLFGKINDVEVYMYDYARMIDDAYEEAIAKKYE